MLNKISADRIQDVCRSPFAPTGPEESGPLDEELVAKAQAGDKDALERLQSEYIKEHLGSLKAFVNTGVTVSVVRDSEGDTTLYFRGRPGVSLFNPRYSSGKYAISVLQ